MLNRTKNILKSSNGFTILELIVVIAIMGFLIALVAPKLAGITDSSKTPTCRTNQQRIAATISRKLQEDGKLPQNLIDLIPEKDSGKMNIGKPLEYSSNINVETNKWVSDGKKNDNAFFSEAFAKNNHLYVHNLSKQEINELKELGVENIIKYDDGGSKETSGQVLMIGSGATTSEGEIGRGDITEGSKISNPELMYRIVLGIGDESELVEKRMLSTVGSCPTALQNKKYIKYNNYSIVLPRLKATIKRLNADASKPIIADGYAQGTKLSSIKSGSAKPTIRGMKFEINKAQKLSKFTIICPEDEKLSESEIGIWNVK